MRCDIRTGPRIVGLAYALRMPKPHRPGPRLDRRTVLTALASVPAFGLASTAAGDQATTTRDVHRHQGRIDDATHAMIDRGLRIDAIETFVKGAIALVRLRTQDGREGWGQVAPYEPEITVEVLHRLVAPHVLGQDAADVDAIVDRAVEANHKYPWSFVCRAVCGVDTAIWDLYGRVRQQPVAALAGGARKSVAAYGSSMRRDISPADEAARLARLADSRGFRAFKIRVGREVGRDGDAAPGRTEAIVPAVRKAVGDRVQLFADANSGYTPPKAIEVGRRLEDAGYSMYEEPCPYWELEWTAEVSRALRVPVSGGEQDNDLAQWRRMLAMRAVDVAQPDACYVGGFTRALRVARMAESAGIPVIPHSANLSLVQVFSLHLMAAAGNAGDFMEFTIEADAAINRGAAEMYAPQLVVEDGRVRVPDGPGWGVEIRAAWLESAARRVSNRT
jgi:L-alanine-DL-glutamate epimerase-like enolase superfamily enzyme